MDSTEICRVCVEEVNCYWFMFESCEIVPSGLTPAQIIAECANIEIERDDGLPESVCKSCLKAMVSAYEIREKCISSDRKLRKLLLHKKGSIEQRATKRPQQAFQTDNEIETKRQTTDDGKEAHESTDEGDLNADYHTEPEYVDASHEEVEGLEPDSYNVDYLIDVKQEQQEDYDDNDEDQSISGDDDEVGDDQYNSVGDKTIDMEHHMIIHSNVKPFKCDQCAKGFFYRTDLVRHEVKHTGIYPFECEKCQQKFSRKISLTKHLPRCKGQKKESLAKKAAGCEVANK
uniref:ZAD domain-containing protein n=1 Tax=Anopheles minimus TaxID=112268 RepID=A0A182W7J0_9DIPT